MDSITDSLSLEDKKLIDKILTSNMEKKNYIDSNAKAVKGKYGTFLSLKLKKEQLQALPVDQYGYVKLVVAKRKEVGKFGETHYVYEDTFQPKPKDNTNLVEEELDINLF